MRRESLLLLATAGVVAFGVRHLLKKNHDSFSGQTVVITGGWRGLGLELGRCFCAAGARLIFCARNPQEIARAEQELRSLGGDAVGKVCDVTNADQVRRFIDAAAQRTGRIDVLVNNAGIIQAGPLESMTREDYERAIETHVWGPLEAIQAALPYMRKQQEGRIVNIASFGGKISVPHLLPYCVSKFALVGLSQGLRSALAAENISVTTVSPGLMRTGSPRNALFKGQHRAEYAWFSIGDSLPVLSMNAARAARQIVAACQRRQAEVVLSLPARLAVRIHGLLPELTEPVLALVNRCLPRPGGIGVQNLPGEKSFSRWSPSLLTMLTERAAVRNNQL